MSITVQSNTFAKSLAKSLAIVAAMILVLSAAQGSARAAGTFSTALIACSPSVLPAQPVAICGTDLFQSGGKGSVTINDVGDVVVSATKASVNVTYTAMFVAVDGSAPLKLGSFLANNKTGDGSFRADGFFKFGVTGAGNVELMSTTGVDFVSGVAISPNQLPSGQDFEPSLVRCAAVTEPDAISSVSSIKCGTDPLSSGHAEIDNDFGDLTIRISGAATGATYTAALVAQNGTSMPLGSLQPMSAAKNNTSYFLAKGGAFPASDSLSGTVEVSNSGTVEFLSGFQVTQHPASPVASAANLVRCSDSTNPDLNDCGSDPLDTGSTYQVDTAGKLTVQLVGASPSTNYEVFFRPLDDSGDQDTGLEVSTNPGGNEKVNKVVFASGSVSSGTFVLKEIVPNEPNQPDQYVAGFKVK